MNLCHPCVGAMLIFSVSFQFYFIYLCFNLFVYLFIYLGCVESSLLRAGFL